MHPTSITPIFRIFDESKAREFYLDWLGFSVDFEHRLEENAPIYLGVSMGDIQLHLSEHSGDGTPHSIIQIQCSGLRGFHKNLKPYKYYRPSVEPYQWIEGYIHMTVNDPFKNVLVFLEKEG